MILEEIVQNKRLEIELLKTIVSLESLKDAVRLLPKKEPIFINALIKDRSIVSVIAEIKKK